MYDQQKKGTNQSFKHSGCSADIPYVYTLQPVVAKEFFMKKARKPRTTGENMCPDCFSFGCNPMSMSHKFSAKIDKRRAAGLCGACGRMPCRCKSSMSVRPPEPDIPKHMVKKLRELRRFMLLERLKYAKSTAG